MQPATLLPAAISAAAGVAAALIAAYFMLRGKRLDASAPNVVADAYSTLVADLRSQLVELQASQMARDGEYEAVRLTAEQARDAEARCLRRLVRMEDEMHMLRAQLRSLGIPIPERSDRRDPITNEFPPDGDPAANG